jgi:peptidoglycan/LPS O-acetylase OafA/YrhL
MLRTHKPTYRPDIDGLRAIAVLVVVGFHAAPSRITGGFAGVDVFFVISGYLISGIVLDGLAGQRFSFAEFYVRRIKRIFPALLLVLAACCALGWFAMFPSEYEQLGKHVAAAIGFVLNFVLWREAGYFDTEAVLKPLLHLWSLSIEEQFYIVWPAILLLAWRRGYNIPVVAAVIAAISFLINVAWVNSDPVATFYMPFTRAWELMLGSLLAGLERLPKSTAGVTEAGAEAPFASARWLRELAGLGGLGMIILAVVELDPGRAFPGWWALLPTVGTFLVIYAGMGASLNRYVLAQPPLVFVGLISYPLYLWHWPLLSFAWLTSIGDPSRLLRIELVIAAFGLAWLTYELVERRIRSSRVAKPAVALAVIAVLIGVAGYSIEREHGFWSRAANSRLLSITDYDATYPGKFYKTVAPCETVIVDSKPIYQCQTSAISNPKFAVFGDSHGWVLYPGLAEALPNIGSMYLASCAFPLVGLTVSNKPLNQFCAAGTSENQVKYLAGIASIETVVLSFRGPLYLTGKGFGVGSQEREHNFVIEHTESTPQGATQAQLFSLGVSAAIDVLEHAGKKIVLVADFPELGFDITECVNSRLFAPKFPECRIPRSAVVARQMGYRAVLEELRSRHPNIAIFDTMPLLCDQEYCYGIRDRRAIYLDDDHIGLYGSKLVGGKLAEFLGQRGFVD